MDRLIVIGAPGPTGIPNNIYTNSNTIQPSKNATEYGIIIEINVPVPISYHTVAQKL